MERFNILDRHFKMNIFLGSQDRTFSRFLCLSHPHPHTIKEIHRHKGTTDNELNNLIDYGFSVVAMRSGIFIK